MGERGEMMKRNSISSMAITISIFYLRFYLSFFQLICLLKTDTTPPELVDFSFSPTTVNVATGAATVTATSRVTDDISGFLSKDIICDL